MVLCGDGFMDFIYRPKSKILKTLKNIKNLKSRLFESWLYFRPQVNGVGEEKNIYSVGPSITGWRLALSKGPNRIGVLLFSPSIHLKVEAEPASETL
jgi:hypothetical protein